MKKILLLASFALAAMAIAMPAAAQATAPTVSGHEHFEGRLGFKVLLGGAAGSTFGCDVTITVSGNGGTTATVEEFVPTTETCAGTGVFAGCELVEHSSNAPFDAHTNTSNHHLTTTTATVQNVYAGCLVPGSHLHFNQVTVLPTNTAGGTTGNISTLDVHAVTSNGGLTVDGTLHAETDEQLVIST